MNLFYNYRKPLLGWFLLCLGWSGIAGAEEGELPWVLVDTEKLTLSVMRGESPELVMEDIAIGRFGTTRAKHRGDNRTPLGEFRIAWIKWDSRFHRFIGLDYPNLEHGRRGFEAGRIRRPRQTGICRPRTPTWAVRSACTASVREISKPTETSIGPTAAWPSPMSRSTACCSGWGWAPGW